MPWIEPVEPAGSVNTASNPTWSLISARLGVLRAATGTALRRIAEGLDRPGRCSDDGSHETLIRNIARAQSWFERVRSGETFVAFAEADGTLNRRVQQMIGLASLAPDIVRRILDGSQPLGFTSD